MHFEYFLPSCRPLSTLPVLLLSWSSAPWGSPGHCQRLALSTAGVNHSLAHTNESLGKISVLKLLIGQRGEHSAAQAFISKLTIRTGPTASKIVLLTNWFNIRKYTVIHMFEGVNKKMVFGKIHTWVYLLFSKKDGKHRCFLAITHSTMLNSATFTGRTKQGQSLRPRDLPQF